ncbi:hypothetical protein ACVWZL_009196 [Bradyrhizobium sp. GM2.4]
MSGSSSRALDDKRINAGLFKAFPRGLPTSRAFQHLRGHMYALPYRSEEHSPQTSSMTVRKSAMIAAPTFGDLPKLKADNSTSKALLNSNGFKERSIHMSFVFDSRVISYF